jgi:hypothetical protein
VNRKLLVVVAVAAVLALLAGAAVGRNLLSSATPEAPNADVVRFKDDAAKVSIAYPAAWTRLADRPDEPDLALLVAKDDTATMLMRISNVGLEEVTKEGLPVVRKFTDGLLAEDTRITQIVPAVAVELGGLPGWRYRYAFGPGGGTGAHDHYFLFKSGRMIQLVFEAVPPRMLPTHAPEFDRIAATFRGRET